ncbi:MAG TPA: Stk1 family PASTA domain-containing Ser/Thr kinase [Acidimicrobiales bacterium]|nr:Stk1 family PASTA domain-containing Ser/Thr kinase [Acidimicrobiales bacterium]
MEPIENRQVFSNRYELTHRIARGGMADVYRARDRLLDRPVALKILFPELSVDRAFVERFRREAQAAANLSHPNIVPVFDWGEDDGTYFIVMEFVDGRPLSAVLRDVGPLAPEQAADIGAHVAGALAFAHRHGVIHRDVKPGNVLITSDNQVKVTDFGIARAMNTEESLTQTGAVMGTATYFSPEQAEGVGVDARSDVYSLGVVLFEMLTGRPPFLGDTPVAVASKHVRDTPPLPSELRPDLPVELEAVVMKAMAKSPDQRYDSAEDLRADLLRFEEGRPVLADQTTAIDAYAAGSTAPVPTLTGANRTELVPGRRGAPVTVGISAAVRRRARRGPIALLVVLLAALVVVAVLLVNTLSGGFDMPNLVGQTVAQATTALQAKHLLIGAETPRSSNRAPGIVLGTDPAAGSTVKKGDRVDLIVSGALSTVTEQDVVGDDLAGAEALLSSQNLHYKVIFVDNSGAQEVVLTQNPAAGAKVPIRTVVQLTVPRPSNQVTIDDVQGDTPTQASNILEAQGLQVGSQSMQCSNTQQSGNVSATQPAAGSKVARNTTVNLVVSSGACNVVVQNVIGDDQQTATSALDGQGLTVSPAQTINCLSGQNGNVVDQSPEGGTQVTLPSTVTITVCSLLVPPTTTTTLPGP